MVSARRERSKQTVRDRIVVGGYGQQCMGQEGLVLVGNEGIKALLVCIGGSGVWW